MTVSLFYKQVNVNVIKSKATDVNMGYSYEIITFLDVYRCDCFTTTLVETEQH